MRKGLTEVIFILDRSGSMSGLEADTIGGFNSMIAKQKKEEGEAYISTVLFDDKTEVSIPMQKCILFGNSEHPFPEKQSIPFRSRVQLMISTQVESLFHVM